MNVKEILNKLKDKGISQCQISRDTSISKASLHNWTHNKVEPHPLLLGKLERYLKVKEGVKNGNK